MRTAALAALISLLPTALVAQLDVVPSRLAQVELARSRACVGTLAQIATLDGVIQPLVVRASRLREIAGAVALEDRSAAEPFDADDPTEALIRDWFRTDAALAQRYVTTEDPGLLNERQAGRETIKAVVTQALASVQERADSTLDANASLLQAAGPCDGAIFVRSAVEEACTSVSSPLCDQAALPPGQSADFRFVDSGESVWEIREDRPWTVPSPLQPNGDGQLGGGRTIGYARIGNVAVSLSFSPLFRDRERTSSEELEAYTAINDSLGIRVDHPALVVVPALGLRAALPEPLGTETRYIVHFGDIDAPDIVWTGPAASGTPLEATIPLAARHVVRLRSGDPVMLTAAGGPDGNQPEFSIIVGNVNQGPATAVLLNYMASQMAEDLERLVQPRG